MMPNPNYTALLFIADVSGSMEADDTGYGKRFEIMQNALHKMLEQQARKLAGYLSVDVGYFDNSAYFGEQDADPMKVNLSLYAAGGTEMYDSVPVLLDWFKNRLDALPENEQPGHVVVTIVTDGQSSHARTPAGINVASKIQGLIKDGWDFAYVAAYRGALGSLGRLGLPRSSGIEEPFTPEGVERIAEQLGSFVTVARGGGKAHF